MVKISYKFKIKQLCNTIGGDRLLHLMFAQSFNRRNMQIYTNIELKFYKRKYEEYIS